MKLSEEIRTDLSMLVQLGHTAAAGISEAVFFLGEHLAPERIEVEETGELARPSRETEVRLDEVRRVQRAAAANALALRQLRADLQRHAVSLVLRPDSEGPAATIGAIVWHLLRQSILRLDEVISGLEGASLVSGGPGPITSPGEVSTIRTLERLRRAFVGEGVEDSGDEEPDA